MNTLFQGQNKKCLFDCIYCFTKENYTTNGQRKISESELETVDIIQPFCDYDIFASRDCNWKDEINKYISYGKIISFATKAYISKEKASYLAEVNKKHMNQGTFLHVGVSITTVEKASEIEKHAPSFYDRCESLKNLHSYNIPCSVIIRPVLPVLTERDISIIIDNTCSYCDNYVYGPLFMNSEIAEYLQSRGIEISTIPLKQRWLDNNQVFQAFHSDDYSRLIDYLINYCKVRKKNIWRSNVYAIDDIRKSYGL